MKPLNLKICASSSPSLQTPLHFPLPPPPFALHLPMPERSRRKHWRLSFFPSFPESIRTLIRPGRNVFPFLLVAWSDHSSASIHSFFSCFYRCTAFDPLGAETCSAQAGFSVFAGGSCQSYSMASTIDSFPNSPIRAPTLPICLSLCCFFQCKLWPRSFFLALSSDLNEGYGRGKTFRSIPPSPFLLLDTASFPADFVFSF